MGFVFQVPPVVGGTVLIIERIESQNYSPGVTGWALWADGTADLQAAIIRGDVVIGDPASNHLEGNTNNPDGAPGWNFFTGATTEADPGYINSSGPGSTTALSLQIVAPQHNLATELAYILLQTVDPAINPLESAMELHAKDILAGAVIKLASDPTWTALPLSGTWGDLAGARAGYIKDVSGRVQLRGVVVGGANPTIGVLPAGYRPFQSMEWVMRGQGGVVLCAVSVSTAGVLTATANAATAQANGVRLDSISFPITQ